MNLVAPQNVGNVPVAAKLAAPQEELISMELASYTGDKSLFFSHISAGNETGAKIWFQMQTVLVLSPCLSFYFRVKRLSFVFSNLSTHILIFDFCQRES
jgi:hypothetical protein